MEERYALLQQLAKNLIEDIERVEQQQDEYFEDNAIYDVHYIMNKMIVFYEKEFPDFCEI